MEQKVVDSLRLPRVRRHLLHVYATLASMMLVTVAATVLAQHVEPLSLGAAGGGAVLCAAGVSLIGQVKPSSGMAVFRRSLAYLFALLKGFMLASLADILAGPDSTGLIIEASVGALMVFVGFSIAALFTSRRWTLYLGGVLGSSLLALLVLSLANVFLNGLFFQAELFLGLLIFSLYLLYDTQSMIANAASGGPLDDVAPAINLYSNLFGVLIRLLILLGRDRERNKASTKRR